MRRLLLDLAQLSWREPWCWPSAWQRGSYVLSGVVGAMLLSPWWWGHWQAWQDAHQAEVALTTQQEHTQRLRTEATQFQQAHQAFALGLSDVKTLGHLAESEGLQLSQLRIDKSEQTPQLHALQLQQLPVRMSVQGPWQAWLNWLSRWPTDAQGVTVSSLELKAGPNGGVRAQLLVAMPQSTDSPRVAERVRLNAQDGQDPFSAQAWTLSQRGHAAQHPSFAQLVAPEMLRARDVLEAFPRERLQYVGHIESAQGLEALVKVLPADAKSSALPSVHRVRVGSHLGHDFGQVLIVGPQALIVQELGVSPAGEWKTREVHLPLIEAGP